MANFYPRPPQRQIHTRRGDGGAHITPPNLVEIAKRPPIQRLFGRPSSSGVSSNGDRHKTTQKLELRLYQLKQALRRLKLPESAQEARTVAEVKRRLNIEVARMEKELSFQKLHLTGNPNRSNQGAVYRNLPKKDKQQLRLSGSTVIGESPRNLAHQSTNRSKQDIDNATLGAILGLSVQVIDGALDHSTVSVAFSQSPRRSSSSRERRSPRNLKPPDQINSILAHLHNASERVDRQAALPQVESSESQLQVKAAGLSPAALAYLPSSTLTERLDEPCSICLEDMESNQRVICLPICSHIFHRPCIMTWLSRSIVCPLCKQPTKADEQKSQTSQIYKTKTNSSSSNFSEPQDSNSNSRFMGSRRRRRGSARRNGGQNSSSFQKTSSSRHGSAQDMTAPIKGSMLRSLLDAESFVKRMEALPDRSENKNNNQNQKSEIYTHKGRPPPHPSQLSTKSLQFFSSTLSVQGNNR